MTPEYMLAFLDSFLLAGLPVTGLVSATTNGGAASIHSWPSGVSILAGILVGAMNGIRAVRNLRMPPPTKGVP